MKKIKIPIILIILVIVACLFILNMKVTTRQGINYEVHTLRIPLYLKVLDFYDRHYNYKWLVHQITKGKTNGEEKVMAIFEWTIKNIVKQPPELRTVDDHVWHIIVRGYGTDDQFSDVFSTLCNYAGNEAFFTRLSNRNNNSLKTFAFVKIDGKWYVFDPYNGAYFTKETDNSFASVEDIVNGNWQKNSYSSFSKHNIEYPNYFDSLLKIDFKEAHKWSRANIQTPFNRLIYEIKKIKSKQNMD